MAKVITAQRSSDPGIVYKLRQITDVCPEQWEVFTERGEQVGYIRLRHGRLSCKYPDVNGVEVYSHNFVESRSKGCFYDQEERNHYLSECLDEIILVRRAQYTQWNQLDEYDDKLNENIDSRMKDEQNQCNDANIDDLTFNNNDENQIHFDDCDCDFHQFDNGLIGVLRSDLENRRTAIRAMEQFTTDSKEIRKLKKIVRKLGVLYGLIEDIISE